MKLRQVQIAIAFAITMVIVLITNGIIIPNVISSELPLALIICIMGFISIVVPVIGYFLINYFFINVKKRKTNEKGFNKKSKVKSVN